MLREIAHRDHPVRSSQLATWALELIFGEPRAEETSADPTMAPLRLEIPVHAAPSALDAAEPNEPEPPVTMAETLPFTAPDGRPGRFARTGPSEEFLRELIG